MTPSRPFSVSKHLPVSLAERAYQVIRDRILKGDLPLGTSLSRRKLAVELEMSLVPVAEALQKLETEGLVESRPRIGTRVCQPTAQEIRERYEVREALEAHSARLFAERAGPKERQEMLERAEQMDALFNRCFTGGENNPEFLYAVHRQHMQLHLRLAECTACNALCQAIEKNQVLVFNWLFDVAAQRPPLPPRFHRELMMAVCEGDAEAADRAMRQHIRYGLDNIVKTLSV